MVTTAKLGIAKYERESIDLATGDLPQDRGEFEEVPWLRYRKPMVEPKLTGFDLHAIRQSAERTVLVTNSRYVIDVPEAIEKGTT